jgi:hypothetical protein
VSLILEALKKIDREKQAPERGFVVLGAAPWGSRERASWGVLAGLVAIAVGVGGGLAVAFRRPPAPAAAQHQVVPAARRTDATPRSPVPAAAPSRPTLAPDPAVPAGAPATPRPGGAPAGSATAAFTLVAISQRDGRPVALLNDRLVREGDSFDGVTIVRIGSDEVEVEVNGRRRVIGF